MGIHLLSFGSQPLGIDTRRNDSHPAQASGQDETVVVTGEVALMDNLLILGGHDQTGIGEPGAQASIFRRWSITSVLWPASCVAMNITGLNHVTLAVSDLDRSVAFYCGLLGFSLRMRSPSS